MIFFLRGLDRSPPPLKIGNIIKKCPYHRGFRLSARKVSTTLKYSGICGCVAHYSKYVLVVWFSAAVKLFRDSCWLLAFLRRYVLWIVLWITTQVKFHSFFSYYCFCILKGIKFRICQTETEKFHLKHSCAIVSLGNIWNSHERHFFALRNSAKFRLYFFFSIGHSLLRLFLFFDKI